MSLSKIVDILFFSSFFAVTMPTLNQMTIEVRNSYTDGFRWSLFAWTLGFDNEFILKVQNSFESKFMRIVQYTLKFLLLVSVRIELCELNCVNYPKILY